VSKNVDLSLIHAQTHRRSHDPRQFALTMTMICHCNLHNAYAMLTDLMTLEHDMITAGEDDASSEAAAAAASQHEAESH